MKPSAPDTESRTRWVCLAVILVLFPKILLIRTGDSGVRLEDFILLALAPACLRLLLDPGIGMRPLVRGLTIYYSVVFASGIAAVIAGRVDILSTLAFAVRPIFYTSSVVVGFRVGFHDRAGRPGLVTIVGFALMVHVAYGIGAMFDIVPLVGVFDQTRLAGLTNGPYDLSTLLCLFLVMAVPRRPAMSAVAIVGLLLTRARIALIAFVIHLLIRSAKRFSVGTLIITIVVALLAIEVVAGRGDGFNIENTLDLVADFRDVFSEAASSRAMFEEAFEDPANSAMFSAEGDKSALIRIARWSMVLATTTNSPQHLLIGMGPNYYAGALDGNYVRLIGETGLIGLITYVLMLLSIRRCFKQTWTRALALALVIQLLVVAIFIDIFISIKTMSLLWMAVGALKRDELDPPVQEAADAND